MCEKASSKPRIFSFKISFMVIAKRMMKNVSTNVTVIFAATFKSLSSDIISTLIGENAFGSLRSIVCFSRRSR